MFNLQFYAFWLGLLMSLVSRALWYRIQGDNVLCKELYVHYVLYADWWRGRRMMIVIDEEEKKKNNKQQHHKWFTTNIIIIIVYHSNTTWTVCISLHELSTATYYVPGIRSTSILLHPSINLLPSHNITTWTATSNTYVVKAIARGWFLSRGRGKFP